jgi:hypothetical protein
MHAPEINSKLEVIEEEKEEFESNKKSDGEKSLDLII